MVAKTEYQNITPLFAKQETKELLNQLEKDIIYFTGLATSEILNNHKNRKTARFKAESLKKQLELEKDNK